MLKDRFVKYNKKGNTGKFAIEKIITFWNCKFFILIKNKFNIEFTKNSIRIVGEDRKYKDKIQ